MTSITYVGHAGSSQTVEVTPGASVMKGAVRNGIAGIDAICDGGCACGTCHVYVDDAWFDRLSPISVAEEALLGVLKNTRSTSRLSCQIAVSDRLDGLVVLIPEHQ